MSAPSRFAGDSSQQQQQMYGGFPQNGGGTRIDRHTVPYNGAAVYYQDAPGVFSHGPDDASVIERFVPVTVKQLYAHLAGADPAMVTNLSATRRAYHWVTFPARDEQTETRVDPLAGDPCNNVRLTYGASTAGEVALALGAVAATHPDAVITIDGRLVAKLGERGEVSCAAGMFGDTTLNPFPAARHASGGSRGFASAGGYGAGRQLGCQLGGRFGGGRLARGSVMGGTYDGTRSGAAATRGYGSVIGNDDDDADDNNDDADDGYIDDPDDDASAAGQPATATASPTTASPAHGAPSDTVCVCTAPPAHPSPPAPAPVCATTASVRVIGAGAPAPIGDRGSPVAAPVPTACTSASASAAAPSVFGAIPRMPDASRGSGDRPLEYRVGCDTFHDEEALKAWYPGLKAYPDWRRLFDEHGVCSAQRLVMDATFKSPSCMIAGRLGEQPQ